MQTAKSHQALLLTTRPTTLFTNMTILHLLPKKSSRELKLKSACPHLHADRHTPSSCTHLICYSIFSFFVWCLGFCIWFDLLKPVVMGFQPVVNLFAFFFFFSLFDVWVFASDLFHFGARGDEFSTRGDEVYIFYIWVFRPMLTSKIKQPTSQTEQYPQATTFPWFIYPYPWALLSFSKLLLNLFKFYKKELLIFTLK